MIAPLIEIIEFTVTADEMLEVEKYLEFLDDLAEATKTGQELLGKAAGRSLFLEEVILGFFSIIGALAVVAMAASYETEAEAKAALRQQKKERRRKKTAICAKDTLDIIKVASRRVHKGDFSGKDMPTLDNVPRYPRKFQSRA